MDKTVSEAVREAVLALALAPNLVLTHEAVARESGTPVDDIRALCPDRDALISFTIRPLAQAVDDLLRRLPIHQSATPAQQREVLAALLEASLQYPEQQALVIRAMTSKGSRLMGRADSVAYQAGVRLLGINYDTKPELMTRVYFATEMIALSVCTNRHDFTKPGTRDLLLDSLLAVLNPPVPVPRRPPNASGSGRGRALHRWNDPRDELGPG